ncbi:MAG: MauE/DoxX family redox-associated membrane protein [Planctomycetaceae bacterium]
MSTHPTVRQLQLPSLLGYWWSVSGSLLMFATLPVWRPDTESLLPRIPLVGWGLFLPLWLEWTALIGNFIGLLLAGLATYYDRRTTFGFLIWLLSTGILIVGDQVRFQPWWMHLAISGWILTFSQPKTVALWLRLLLAGIYGWSAWSKWDYSFLTSHGRELTSALFQSVGMPIDFSPATLTILALLLPLGETIAAAMLLFSRTQRYGLYAALVMHLLLGLALGPTGLNHSRGVHIWNAVCIAELLCLIALMRCETREVPPLTTSLREVARKNRIVATVVMSALLFPMLSPWGWCDPWCAWELYASRPARAELYIDYRRRSALPSHVRRFVDAGSAAHPWCRVRIETWALEEYAVPLAPGWRLPLAISSSLAETFGWKSECRVEIYGPADRFTGHRRRRTLRGEEEIQQELKSFLLNVSPRSVSEPIKASEDDLQ